MKSLVDEFFLTMEDGAYKHQKDHASGYSLPANSIRDETDTVDQIRPVGRMIVARVNTLVLVPTDSKTLVPVVKKAVNAGILVINIDNRLDPAVLEEKGLNVPPVGPDSRKGARLVGNFTARSLKPGDTMGIIEGISTIMNTQQHTAGFKDTTGAAKLKITGVQSGEQETNKGNKVTTAMLRSRPDLKVLLCGNDNMVIDAVSVVCAASKPDKVLIGGYGNVSTIKVVLADGCATATADQHADQQTIYDIETALRVLASKAPQAKLSGVVKTPVNLVTRS